jgi:hypothetical protein
MPLDLENLQDKVNFFKNEAGRHYGKGPFDRIRHRGEDNIEMTTREIIAWLIDSR